MPGPLPWASYGDALESLLEVLEIEVEDCRQRRTARLTHVSRLPVGKTWDTFQRDRLSTRVNQKLGEFARGEFVERSVNVLAFGLPGTREDSCHVCHWTPTGGDGMLCPVHAGLLPGTGFAGSQT